MSELHIDNTPAGQVINILSDWDIHKTANNDETISIMNDRTTAIGTDDNTTIGGEQTTTVQKSIAVTSVTDAITVDAHQNISIQSETADITEQAKTQINLIVGGNVISIDTKGTIVMTAASSITLNCGASHLCLNSGGDIVIKGATIALDGSTSISLGAPTIAAAASTQAKLGVGNQNIICDTSQTGIAGAAINSAAVGTHNISGAVVKIN